MNDQEFEKRFLDFVYTTDQAITPSAVAYFAGSTIDEASEHLNQLAARGVVNLDSDDDGNLFYVFPHRTNLAAKARAERPMMGQPPMGPPFMGPPHMGPRPMGPPPHMGPPPMGPPLYPLVPVAHARPPAHQRCNPSMAALVAVLFPGAGHIYAGHIGAGLLWMLFIIMGYVFVFPGLVLHGVSIWAAWNTANRENAHSHPPGYYPPHP